MILGYEEVRAGSLMGAGRVKMVTLLEHGLDALGWVNAVTLLLVFLAGWAAWKKTIASTSQEIYQRVAQAYKAEVEALQERMRLLEQENEGLRHLLETIKRSLARRGLRVTEEGLVKKRASEQAGERVSEDEREQPGD